MTELTGKAREYYRDMCEHDFPILTLELSKLNSKYKKVIEFINYMACDLRLDDDSDKARELLRELGELNE